MEPRAGQKTLPIPVANEPEIEQSQGCTGKNGNDGTAIPFQTLQSRIQFMIPFRISSLTL